jgi:hypothetical protein
MKWESLLIRKPTLFDLLRICPLMSITETLLRQEVIEIFQDWRGKVLKNQPMEAKMPSLF